MIKHLLRLLILILAVSVATGMFTGLEAFPGAKNHLLKRNYFRQTDPVITVTGSLDLCPGGSVRLTATDAPTGATIQWFKDGAAINNATSINYTATQAGSYYATINFAGTDTNYTPVNVTLNPYPTATFSNQPINACNASIVKFTSTTSSNVKYLWDFGDLNSGSNNTSTSANPVHKFIGSSTSVSQSFYVQLKVTSDAGCSYTYARYVTAAVSNAQLGGLNPSVYNDKQYFSVCGNNAASEFTFTNKSTTPAANTNYNISWGDGSPDFTNASFTSTKHTYNAGSYTLTYIVSGQGVCKDTLQYGIFVGTNPAVGLGNPGNTVICTGAALTFPVTGTANNPAGTLYTVTYGDGTPPRVYTSAPDTITHYFLTSSCNYVSGTYYNSFSATIVASNPCNSSTATVTPIYVSQKPKAQFAVSPSDIACINNTVTFSNTSQGNTASNGTCVNNNFVWSVSPATGYTVYSGSLGNDFGSDQASVWTNGSTYLYLRFTIPGTYTVKLRTGGSNCGNDMTTKTICVTAPPVASFTADNLTGCSPLAVKTTNTTPASTCGINTYRWTVSPSTGFTLANNTTLTSANPEFNFINAGTYTLSLVATSLGGGCTSNTATQTITVRAKPTFTLNAAGSICAGNSITPTAAVTAGTGLTYAWTFEGGTPATSTAANPGTVVYATAGSYTTTLTITNDCGFTTLTNLVMVKEVPTITAPADLSFCAGAASGVITFTGNPTTTTYAWRNDNTASGLAASGTGNIAGFTTRNTGLTPIIANITVTPSNNGCNGTPVTFKITINPKPLAPTVTSPLTYCVNDVATALTATAATGNTLNWYSNSTLTTKLTEAPTPATAAAGATTYYVTQTNATDCESVAASVIINVNPAIGNNTISADQTICYNNIPAQLRGAGTLSGGTGQYTFQWQSSADGAVWTNINGATGATYSPPALTASTQFKRVAFSGNCSLSSNAVTINVQGLLGNYNIGSSQTICSNTAPELLSGQAPTGGNGTFAYQWESSLNNSTWTIIPDATAADYQPAALTALTYYRRLTSSGTCSNYSSVVTISIIPQPVANAGTDARICAETYQLNGNVPAAGTTGSWAQTAGPAATIANATSAATPVTGLQKGNRYGFSWTVTNGNCTPGTASVKVDVLADVINTIKANNTAICPGDQVNLTTNILSGGDVPNVVNASYTFAWEISADNTNWQTLAGATTENISVKTASDTYYRRKVKSYNLCEFISNSILIKVQPPLASNQITGIKEVCISQSAGLLTGSAVTGGDGNYLYQWQSSSNGTVWTNITNATEANFTTPILSQTIYYRRMVSSASCAAVVQSVSNSWQIIVHPDAKAEFTAINTTGCVPFDLSKVIKPVLHDDVNGSYEWFTNGVSIGKSAAFPGYIIKNDGENISIKLITTSKFGCNTSELELNFNTVKTVSASFTKDQTKGCGPITAHFVNTSQPLNGGTYLWDFGNGQTSTQIQPNDVTFLQHPQNRDTTYLIKLAVTTSCGTTFYIDSIHVRPTPKAVFTPDKTIGCSPFEITLTNQSTGLPNTYTYYFGNGEKQVLTDNQTIKYTYTTTKTDTLTLKLVAENECGKDSSFYKIVVYPNTIQAKLVVNGDNQFGCSPVTVNFYNNSTGANTFNWDFGDGNTTVTTKAPETLLHTFTKAGIYNVKLTASNGCSTASTGQVITVYEQPLASFSIQKLQYCVRDSVVLTNNSTQGNFAYRWDFGDGSTSNDTNPKHPYAKPGTYVITLTLTQSYANGSACTNTVSHTTEVLAAPDAAFLSNSGTLNCAPFTLQVSAAPVNALNPVWSFGDVASGTSNQAAGYTASHTFTKAGVYRVLLTTYNQTGCADSTFQVVRITESPLAAFSPGDSVLCGTTATVNFVNKTTYSGAVSYRWVINNALISTQKNLTYAFIPPANAAFPYRYQVRLIAAGISGCTDTVTHQILLNGFPKAVFTVKNVSGCAPFKAEILNTSLYADQFKWYLNNQLVATDQNPQSIILTQSAQIYQLKLVVSNALGCKADSLTTTISTFAKPVAAFSLKDSLSCNSRLDVQISNKTTGATSYTWNFGDGTSEVTTATPLHTYGIPGTYYLRLVAYNGFCRDTIIHTVKIASPPQAAFTADNLKGCTQVTATFQNISTNATTYLWDFGDGTFSSGKNPTHTFSYLKSPYNIKLIAIGEYGCADTTVAANYIVVSAPPKADFTILPDSVIKIPDYTFNFSNKSTGNPISIKWDFGDGKTATTANPTHTYLDTGTYKVKLTVVNTNNCTDILIKTARITGVPGYLFVPNAFEPGSGKNELKTFAVRASGLSAYSLRIFNKWGEMVWQSDKLDINGSPTEGWDGLMHGQPAPQGVYVWYISARFINGTEWKGMKYETGGSTKTGPIHLIR